MTKLLIAGLATIAIAGTAFAATGMYAATSGTNQVHMNGTHMGQRNPEDFIKNLSTKISPEALTALQSLMTKHKTEMDAQKASGTQVDKATMEAQRTTFKNEMDTLMTKYPELKTALPQGGMMGHGKENKEVETILATLPETVQTELKATKDEYKAKQEALRTEEKTKMDSILAAYPEVKAKLDALHSGHGNFGKQNGPRGNHGKMQKKTPDTTTTK